MNSNTIDKDIVEYMYSTMLSISNNLTVRSSTIQNWSSRLDRSNANESTRGFIYTAGSPSMAKYLTDIIMNKPELVQVKFSENFDDFTVFFLMVNIPEEFNCGIESKWTFLINQNEQVCEFWKVTGTVEGGDIELSYESKLVQRLIDIAAKEKEEYLEFDSIVSRIQELL